MGLEANLRTILLLNYHFATQTISTAPNLQITQNLSAESTLSVQQSWTEVRKLGRKHLLGMENPLLFFPQGFGGFPSW